MNLSTERSDDQVYSDIKRNLGKAVTHGWLAADDIRLMVSRGRSLGEIAVAISKSRTTVFQLDKIVLGSLTDSSWRSLPVWSCWPLVVKAERRAKTLAAQEAGLLPSAKYRVVYADPPWAYSLPQHSTEIQVTTLGVHYGSMATDEMCAMDIPALTEDDAVVFLWATSPLLKDGLRVMEAWGFDYKASMVWDKVKHNVGHYVSVRHEFVLIGTKGSCLPDVPKLHDSVFSIPRTGHSEKPDHVRMIIDEIYPHGKRLELFARKASEGWDAWGNQLIGQGGMGGADGREVVAGAPAY